MMNPYWRAEQAIDYIERLAKQRLETEIEQIAKAIHKILELPTEKVRGRLLAWCKSEGITSIADWSEE